MTGFLLHLIPSLLTPTLKHRGFVCPRILIEWEKIVGTQFADHCFPDRIHFPRGQKNNGTLYLVIDPKSAFRFDYIKDLIIERINTYFGYKAIAFVKVFQKPVTKCKKQQDTSSLCTSPLKENKKHLFAPLSHEGLQKALEKYGSSLMAHK